MSRTVVGLGALATAVVLALGASGSAYAADGILVVGGVMYAEPSGCYDTDVRPLTVENQTDEVAVVFSGPDCTGRLVELVAPGESSVSEFAASVYVN